MEEAGDLAKTSEPETKGMRYELMEAKLELEMVSQAFRHCLRHRNTLQKHLDGIDRGPRPLLEERNDQQLFDIEPPYCVAFSGPFEGPSFATLELRNLSYRQDAYFRLKTTHPKSFRVCPTHGVISPGQTRLIVIELCDPADIEELKESKFLVQSGGVPAGLSSQDPQDIWKELFARRQFIYTKLPVVFLDGLPASPTNE